MALSIYDFFLHNFLCPIVDAIHSSDPCHLVTGFQFLSHALRYLHLLNNQGQTLLCLLVQIGKISPELTLQNQVIESHRVMLFQILSVHPSVFSDSAFLTGKLQSRNVVISCQHIFHTIDSLALYVISVRRTRDLFTASFRFHLTMDTLAVRLYTSHYLGVFGTYTR